MTTDDRDPCAGCDHLRAGDTPSARPYCYRNAAPEQIGCTRWPPRGRASGIPAATTHTGDLPPETHRRGKRNGGRRRG